MSIIYSFIINFQNELLEIKLIFSMFSILIAPT